MNFFKLSVLTCAVFAVANNATAQDSLKVADFRQAGTSPGSYNQSMKLNFKITDTVGLAQSFSGGGFVTLMGIRGWNSDAGGSGHELAFGNGAQIFARTGTQASGWQGWRRLLSEDVNGNVGIGLLAPTRKLEVYDTITEAYQVAGSGAGAPTSILSIANMSQMDGNVALLQLTAKNATNNNTVAYIGAVSNTGNGTSYADLIIGRRTSASTYAETMRILGVNGNVGIGTTAPGTYKLAVEGTIGARKVKVTTTSWADFVFDPGYKLRTLAETEAFILENKHLPDVPSAAAVAKDGQDLGEMNKILLQKIEELTLQVIELNKKVEKLEAGKK